VRSTPASARRGARPSIDRTKAHTAPGGCVPGRLQASRRRRCDRSSAQCIELAPATSAGRVLDGTGAVAATRAIQFLALPIAPAARGDRQVQDDPEGGRTHPHRRHTRDHTVAHRPARAPHAAAATAAQTARASAAEDDGRAGASTRPCREDLRVATQSIQELRLADCPQLGKSRANPQTVVAT
jgi:hypothetical protein